MPKQYEAMRDAFEKEGLSSKEAKTKAAKIYNAKHKDSVTKEDTKFIKRMKGHK